MKVLWVTSGNVVLGELSDTVEGWGLFISVEEDGVGNDYVKIENLRVDKRYKYLAHTVDKETFTFIKPVYINSVYYWKG